MAELIILTGQLGSGKTTILEGIAKSLPKNKKIGILINEFAKTGIDGGIIDCSVKEITSGCVCCTRGKDLIKQLNSMKTYDLIILETTGIARLYPLLEVIRRASVTLKSVITVVDGVKLEAAKSLSGETKTQLRDSSLVIISKADIIKHGPRIKEALQKYNKNILLSKGKVSAKVFLEAPQAKIKRVRQRFVQGSHDIQAITYKTNSRISKRDFEAFITKHPIERAKGYIKFSNETVLFNYASGIIDYHPSDRNNTSLVFIGPFSWVDRLALLLGLQRLENSFDFTKICKEMMRAISV